MALASGTRLGPYQIQSPLGAGGMGEVYRARDTRLDRTVAVKVLPEHVASDPELKQRFEREAKTLAALSHPHICPVFDVGIQDGIDFLVMEYLEGETLAQRLEKGALPLDQALRLGIQIADALAAAHRVGIVHRDLKPGNIMLTKSGAKLLDFGLAKLRPAGAMAAVSLGEAPTVSSPLTGAGSILGTLHYMAPEQLEGKDADARTDLFAFGTVLYEMVTGKKAFAGKSAASLIGAIMTAEPQALSQLQPMTPKALEHVTRTCLAKSPDERWQSAMDLHTQLRWVAGNLAAAETVHVQRNRLSIREIAAWSVAALALISTFTFWRSNLIQLGPARPLAEPADIPVATPPGVVLVHDPGGPSVAISPDGRRPIYAGLLQGQRLYLQDLDRRGAAVPILGTEGAQAPFFSSDGKWLAFVANNRLQKLALGGGAPVVLAESGPLFRGGVWSLDDETIYFVPGVQTGIWKVPAQGGKPVQITTPDRNGFEDFAHWWPISVLPGDQRLLYTSCCGRTRIAVLDLATGKRTPIIENGVFARYVPTGHLVFAQGHSLLAARFDPDSLKIGNPVKVLDNFVTGREAHAQYSISQSGTLVYFDGVSDFQRTLVRVERSGAVRPLAKGAWPIISGMRLANDGRRLALSLTEGPVNVFIYDLLRDDFDRAGSANSDLNHSGKSGQFELPHPGPTLAVPNSGGKDDRHAQTPRDPSLTPRRPHAGRHRGTRRRLHSKRAKGRS
ncbi:MAG: protein kinase domain-containing protein [Vicinamibacterales bacterium]